MPFKTPHSKTPLQACRIMETRVGHPSVFVVDAPQRDLPFVPPVAKRQKKCQHAQALLWVFMLLMLVGLAVQGYFLFSFRKELAKATAQEGAEAPTYEKFVQGQRPPTEKPAAHLTLGTLADTAGDGALLWEEKKGLAFLQDMGYKDGSLTCNKSGHYYVYSKLFLGDSSCPATSQWVTHSIYKRTSRYPKEMLLLTNNILSCSWNSKGQWKHNSFLAGVVHLQTNDEVFIKVSQRQMVRVGNDAISYFGTFMI